MWKKNINGFSFIGCAYLLLMCPQSIVAETASIENFSLTIDSTRNSQLVQISSLSDRLNKMDWINLNQLYPASTLDSRWFNGVGLSRDARLLVDRVKHIGAEGLNPADYNFQAIDEALRVESRAGLDGLLTDTVLRIAHDLRSGRFERQNLDSGWHIDQEFFDPLEAIGKAVDGQQFEQFLKDLSPINPDYKRLRQALVRYQEIESAGGWPQIMEGPSLHPGDRDGRVPLLIQRLRIEGDYQGSQEEGPLVYGEALEEAVTRFQFRHGLEADAIIGEKTRRALNISIYRRVAEIRANMERWRWLPQQLGERYLLVNTAGFELRLVEKGQTLLVKRSISGKPRRRTPSFRSQITHLVVNPDWTVPLRIAVEDLLPRQKQDPEYLSSKQINVFRRNGGSLVLEDSRTIDWSLYGKSNFPFVLRQLPGEQNSLGLLKFQMQNPYSIYLHDTPARELFDRPLRAFSSGCIRVEHISQLAGYLLGDGALIGNLSLAELIETGETKRAAVARSIPVFLVYLTVWVDEMGAVQFRPDTYGLDEALIQALHQTPNQSGLALTEH